MSDPTTEGYTVSAAEIEGMVRNLCGYALSEPEPLQRYLDLTHHQVLFDGIVEALRRERGRALADLMVTGMPVEAVAAKTNLGAVPKVRKLITLAGETDRVKAAAKPDKAAKSKKTADAEQPETPPPPPAPITGKRMLTAADRIALGLPAEGPLPRPKPAKRRRAAA